MLETSNHTVLKTENLSIGYTSKKGETIIASNININLYEGELVALVGANGIGKSTLLRTLSKVQKPLKSSVLINNKDLKTYHALDLAKAMSLVLTEPIASKNLSVFEPC